MSSDGHPNSRSHWHRPRYGLRPAAIDDVVLVGAGAAVVGGVEENDAGDVVGHELALEALALHELGLTFGRQPQILLPPGHDPSWQDGVDPDVVRAKIAGERTGQALNRGFRSGVAGHVALPNH